MSLPLGLIASMRPDLMSRALIWLPLTWAM